MAIYKGRFGKAILRVLYTILTVLPEGICCDVKMLYGVVLGWAWEWKIGGVRWDSFMEEGGLRERDV